MSDMILFDLDGTLTDSGPGITRCVQYALASFGIEEPDLEKLNCYVGAPLLESFMNCRPWLRRSTAGHHKIPGAVRGRGHF